MQLKIQAQGKAEWFQYRHKAKAEWLQHGHKAKAAWLQHGHKAKRKAKAVAIARKNIRRSSSNALVPSS